MSRRMIVTAAVAATVAAAAAFAPAASAGTSWSVSIGAPGFAVSAGSPYWAGPAYGPAYGPYWHAPYRHYYAPRVVYRPAYPAPYYYAPSPYYAAPRVVYRAPYVYRPY